MNARNSPPRSGGELNFATASQFPISSRIPHFRKEPFVFTEDDVPPVVASDVLAAAASQGGAQAHVADEQLQALDELVPVGVVETSVAAQAVFDEDRAAGVGENRRADGQRLERQQRQA